MMVMCSDLDDKLDASYDGFHNFDCPDSFFLRTPKEKQAKLQLDFDPPKWSLEPCAMLCVSESPNSPQFLLQWKSLFPTPPWGNWFNSDDIIPNSLKTKGNQDDFLLPCRIEGLVSPMTQKTGHSEFVNK